MPTIQNAKLRRDEALEDWRHQLRLLEKLRANSPKWQEQWSVIEAARDRYDRTAMHYLDLLTGAEPPKHGAA